MENITQPLATIHCRFILKVETMPDGVWRLKLYDLTLAARVATQLQVPCGTPDYMSPEMIRGSGLVPWL
jgi:serine/threonine protein kinase